MGKNSKNTKTVPASDTPPVRDLKKTDLPDTVTGTVTIRRNGEVSTMSLHEDVTVASLRHHLGAEDDIALASKDGESGGRMLDDNTSVVKQVDSDEIITFQPNGTWGRSRPSVDEWTDPTQSTRLEKEIAALRKQYDVRFTSEPAGIELRNWRYPDGWKLADRQYWMNRSDIPRHPEYIAPLLVRFPEGYPRTQPWAYLPRDLRYTDDEVTHRLDTEYREWVLWCVHEFTGWKPTDPAYNLPKFLELMQISFRYPEKDNPIQHHYQQ